MRELLIRVRTDGCLSIPRFPAPISEVVKIEFSREKFWIASLIFAQSYTALFRLHAMKEWVGLTFLTSKCLQK